MVLSITYNLVQSQNITETFKEFGNRLKGFIRNRVKNAHDAEDVFQDVFYQLAEAERLMKPIEHMSAWLYTVARNRINDLYRKKKPKPISEYLSDDEDEGIAYEIRELLSDQECSPETKYLQSMVWEELEKALDELPKEQRIIFEMNELQGISFKEIAEQTGESENTLISRKRYGVLHLRERLRNLYNELINF